MVEEQFLVRRKPRYSHANTTSVCGDRVIDCFSRKSEPTFPNYSDSHNERKVAKWRNSMKKKERKKDAKTVSKDRARPERQSDNSLLSLRLCRNRLTIIIIQLSHWLPHQRL